MKYHFRGLLLQIAIPHEFLAQGIEIRFVNATRNVYVVRCPAYCKDVFLVTTDTASVN